MQGYRKAITTVLIALKVKINICNPYDLIVNTIIKKGCYYCSAAADAVVNVKPSVDVGQKDQKSGN